MEAKRKSRVKVKKVVSSNIEITTTPTVQEPTRVDARSLSMSQYHSTIKEASKKIVDFSVKLFDNNLLSVKMAMMEAVRSLEKKMRENKGD